MIIRFIISGILLISAVVFGLIFKENAQAPEAPPITTAPVSEPVEESLVTEDKFAENEFKEDIKKEIEFELPSLPPEPEPEAETKPEVKTESKTEIIIPQLSSIPPVPPINEDESMSAVVRIRCGNTFGSGFIIKKGEKKYALTAAHVVIDQIELKSFTCDVIFPRKDENGNYRETHYRTGKILAPTETEKNYKEKGIDLAIVEILPLENRAEDAERFPNGYPFINYPFCPSDNLGDKIILWGYAANLGTTITPGAFLSRFEGEVVQYADVIGVLKKPSSEFSGGYVYLPKLESSLDTAVQHHLAVIVSNNNFSGASGGLVFDISKNCILGVNIATLLQDNKVFGFITNPNFEPIKEWVRQAID